MVGLKIASPEDHHQGQQTRKITKEAQKVNVFLAKFVNTIYVTYYCSLDRTTFVKLLEQGKITGLSSFELHTKVKWLLDPAIHTGTTERNPENSCRGTVDITVGI